MIKKFWLIFLIVSISLGFGVSQLSLEYDDIYGSIVLALIDIKGFDYLGSKLLSQGFTANEIMSAVAMFAENMALFLEGREIKLEIRKNISRRDLRIIDPILARMKTIEKMNFSLGSQIELFNEFLDSADKKGMNKAEIEKAIRQREKLTEVIMRTYHQYYLENDREIIEQFTKGKTFKKGIKIEV